MSVRSWLLASWLTAVIAQAAVATAAEAPPPDPLRSVQWETMYKLYLQDRPVVFDDRVAVLAPVSAEDSLAVPVMVDARALGRVKKILVFADLNPLPRVLEFEPGDARPVVGFRVKVQQSTPIRAAVLTADDDRWHVGGVWVEAAGGGCTLPSVGSGDAEWSARLGEVHARLWRRPGDHERVKFSVMHPMDTGLAPGIPAFFLETIEVTGGDDQVLATLRPYEPVSENPMFSLDLPGGQAAALRGRDNNGNKFDVRLDPKDTSKP